MQKQRYDALKTIIEEITSSSGIHEMMEKTLKNAMSIMKAERGFIMAKTPDGDLRIDTKANMDDDLEDETRDIAISRSIVMRVFESGEPVLTHNAMLDSRFTKISSIIKNGVRSVIAVPLLERNVVTGVIYIDNRLQNGVFNDDDLEFMKFYSMEIGIAIDKIRLESEKNYLYKILKEAVSSEVADQILKNGLEIDCLGERKEAAVIFADIRDFTTISEKLSPHKLMTILNAFFEKMTEIVLQSNGCLLKFLGDGFMASFGAPVSTKSPSEKAVMAGISMIAKLSDLNDELFRDYGIRLKIGIGIHSGIVTAGVIGSSLRKEYTLIGDVPNTASRLESLTKDYKAQLIVSEDTLRDTYFQNIFKEIGTVKIRGKKNKLKIYKLAIVNM